MNSELATLGACCRALVATPHRLALPRQPDRRLLTRLTERASLPPARRSVRLTPLVQGQRRAPTAVIAEGVWRPPRLTLGMTSFLVEHPQARFLVDPAMCAGVHATVLRELPAIFRPFVRPEKPVRGLAEVLDRAGIPVDDVQFALPTHLHWDHVAGLTELPDDLPVYTAHAERAFALGGTRAPLGVARGPVPPTRLDLYDLDGPPVLTFAASHDVFGDGSVLVVDLAGHTPGSVGVLLTLADDRRVLLAGDAVWHRDQIRLLREKAPMPGTLVDTDRNAAFTVLHRLHAASHHVEVLPSHDHAAAVAFSDTPRGS